MAEAQRALLAVPTSTTSQCTTKAVGPKLHAIIEASTNNSPSISGCNSVHNIPVLPPSTISESEPYEPSPPRVQPQVSALFGTNDSMAGGGGVGSVTMTPKSENLVTIGGANPPIASSEEVLVNESEDGQCQCPADNHLRQFSSSTRKMRITKASSRAMIASRLFHVLLVDDSPMSRKMLRRTLVAAGHTCEEAEDGSIAVAMINDQGLTIYDAILMDFVMVCPYIYLSLTPIPPPTPPTHTSPCFLISFLLPHFSR